MVEIAETPNPILEFLESKASSLSPLLILTHNHADPDAMASGWALAYLAEKLHGIKSKVVYGGIIGRMENQQMVKLLRVPVKPIAAEEVSAYTNVALVDTQNAFENNLFPADKRPTLIIDHHKKNARTKSERLIIDETVGATATLLVEALVAAKLEIPKRLATALVYGISSETQSLGREATERDIRAYRTVFSIANVKTLSQIQNPQRPTSFFITLSKAIQRAFAVRDIIGVHLGEVSNQDIVAHMADLLLTHENAKWSVVTGRFEGRLCVSLRTRSRSAKAGQLLWRLLGGGSSGGGHAMIAGGAVVMPPNADEGAWQAAEDEFLLDFLESQNIKEDMGLSYPFQEILAEEVGELNPEDEID